MRVEVGFISIRNEDGTQWLGRDDQWGDYAFRRAHSWETFQHLLSRVDESTRNNCPDNGFFGLMNLTFRPCNDEEARAQDKLADAEEVRLEDDLDEFTQHFPEEE